MNQKARNFVLSILVVLASLNVLAWIAVFDLAKPQFLEVNFFDVGQGDAIFIQTPKRNQILIDGGQSSVILEKLGKEMPFWDKSIDLVILTHPERDHLIGLLEVLKKYKVENIFWTGIKRDTSEYQEWQKLIKKERAKIYLVPSVQKVIIGKDISMNFLYPIENLADKEYQNSNDASIVAKLNFSQNSFLFTGDISKFAEEELTIRENSYQFASLNSDVLKVAHHGSKTSTSEEFLKKVSPKIAVISVGKGNPYGHPHQEVLEILNKFGIKVLRTDLDGDIKIISDGQKLKIK
jgi:competence protein ComEC